MTIEDAKQIINRAETTMSVNDARQIVKAEKAALVEDARNVQAQDEARQIIEKFQKSLSSLSKEDSQHLQAKAEDMMTRQILDNAKGALSESEAREVVRNGLKSVTAEDAKQIIQQAEETMSVNEARQFVNTEKAALGDDANARPTEQQALVTEQNERTAVEAKEKSMTVEEAQVIIKRAEETMSEDEFRRAVNVAKEAVLDARMERSSLGTEAKSSNKGGEAESGKGSRRESKGQSMLHKLEKSVVDEAQQLKSTAKKVEKSVIDEAQSIMSTAKKAEAKVAKWFHGGHKKAHQTVDNAVGAFLEHHHNSHITRDAEKGMMDIDPSQIINRAGDMMSVSDFKSTKPSSPGLLGLASPFN
jgi:hypothetical protein